MAEQLQNVLEKIKQLQQALGQNPAEQRPEETSADTDLGHDHAARLTQAKAQLRELEAQLAQQSSGAQPPTNKVQPDA